MENVNLSLRRDISGNTCTEHYSYNKSSFKPVMSYDVQYLKQSILNKTLTVRRCVLIGGELESYSKCLLSAFHREAGEIWAV